MLGLSLREGDYVLIGDDIKILFDRRKGDCGISIGVEAPREVAVVSSRRYEAALAASGIEDDAVYAALNSGRRLAHA